MWSAFPRAVRSRNHSRSASPIASLVLISTSAAAPGDRNLPSPAEAFGRFLATATVDWSYTDSVIEYLVGYSRMLAGNQRPFDEAASRELVRHDVARARDIAATQNHDRLSGDDQPRGSLPSIAVPTLVIHGAADPMFPLAHGQALAGEIPGAGLLILRGAGHGVDRADWEPIVGVILQHTDPATSSCGV